MHTFPSEVAFDNQAQIFITPHCLVILVKGHDFWKGNLAVFGASCSGSAASIGGKVVVGIRGVLHHGHAHQIGRSFVVGILIVNSGPIHQTNPSRWTILIKTVYRTYGLAQKRVIMQTVSIVQKLVFGNRCSFGQHIFHKLLRLPSLHLLPFYNICHQVFVSLYQNLAVVLPVLNLLVPVSLDSL